MTKHAHEHHDDPGLLRRIKNISAANYVIGATELVAGFLTNSSTLSMAGIHDVGDGKLYSMKHQAAGEQDPERKRRIRRRGAMALMGAALSFGSFEIARDLIDDSHQPSNAAAAIGILAAGANIAAAVTMHGKRHHHDGHDTWRHVAQVDVPGSLVTMIIAPLSVRYPELDIAGTALHMALATRVGMQTLQATQEITS